MELTLRSISEQWRLDDQQASLFTAPVRWGHCANDHEPFNIAWLPQRQLGTLEGMIIQARVAHPQQVFRGVENIPPQKNRQKLLK